MDADPTIGLKRCHDEARLGHRVTRHGIVHIRRIRPRYTARPHREIAGASRRHRGHVHRHGHSASGDWSTTLGDLERLFGRHSTARPADTNPSIDPALWRDRGEAAAQIAHDIDEHLDSFLGVHRRVDPHRVE
jgi:hypothetical protein